jgi:hypothetical protein
MRKGMTGLGRPGAWPARETLATVNAWHTPSMVLVNFFGAACSLFRKVKFQIWIAFWNVQIMETFFGNKSALGVRILTISGNRWFYQSDQH